jgi:hypothetical protein
MKWTDIIVHTAAVMKPVMDPENAGDYQIVGQKFYICCDFAFILITWSAMVVCT